MIMIQVKGIPINQGKNHPFNKILFVGMTGKMYIPKSSEEVEDEEFSPMLRCLLIESDHTQQQVKEHWDNNGSLNF